RQRRRVLHERRARRTRVRAPREGGDGRHQRAAAGADGIPLFRRLEAQPVRGPSHVRRGRRALLHALQVRDAALAGWRRQGARVHDADERLAMKLASIGYKDRDLIAAEIGPGELVSIEALLAVLPSSVARPSVRRALARRERDSDADRRRQRFGAPHQKMRDLIRGGPALLEALRQGLEIARTTKSVERMPAAAVRWHPPVRRPGKICAVAMNNSAANERKVSAPDHPAFFLKPSSCLVGHNEPIRIRSYYGSVHPEPELALVIGREVRDIPAAGALDAVFGYTIFDDITGNGMRAEDRFHYYALYPKKSNPNETERVEQHLSYAGRYKGTDTFGAMGPWLVTRDEIANPDDLSVRCSVGGDVVAEDSTRYYNYKVAEVVSFISQFHTLHPGDVVSLGTAFKPGATRKSIHTANLQTVAGPIEIAIEGLGTQSNPVIVEDREIGAWRLN